MPMSPNDKPETREVNEIEWYNCKTFHQTECGDGCPCACHVPQLQKRPASEGAACACGHSIDYHNRGYCLHQRDDDFVECKCEAFAPAPPPSATCPPTPHGLYECPAVHPDNKLPRADGEAGKVRVGCGPGCYEPGFVAALRAEVERLEKNYSCPDCCHFEWGTREKARADKAEQEVERLENNMTELRIRRSVDAQRVAELTRERDDLKEAMGNGWPLIEKERARVAFLEGLIREAPHGTALKPCAVDHYDPETYMDDPMPCDCWKSKALEGSAR
jgi:hypothetical protein